jgi:hypothetical protein
MKVIFDEKNAVSFFKQIDQSIIGDDILKLLKRQVNLQFNFDLDEVGEELEFQILEFEEAGGRKENNLSIVYNKNKKDVVFCLNDIDCNNDVLLLENISTKVKEAYKVLIGEVGEEIEVLSDLFLNINDVSVQENIEIGSKDFKSWEDIGIFNRPFSSIVIVDRYMFKGPEIGGNYGLFEYNLKKIIGALFKNQSQKTNLTFIYQINPFVSRTNQNYDEGPDIIKLKQKVKNAVKSLNRHCPEPNINFIAVPKGKISDDHDRHIITNYLRIKSGDTLVYFDSQGDIITHSNEFDIYSMARKKYRDTTISLVGKLNIIVNETLNQFGNRCLLSDPEKIKNIINF